MKKIKIDTIVQTLLLPCSIKIDLLKYLTPLEQINYSITSMSNYKDLICFLPKYTQLLFIIDTTTSMQQKINKIKYFIKNLIFKKYKNNILRISIILFKDYNDHYVTKVLHFTNNLCSIDKFIDRIGCSGGRDIPEAIETAFLKANQLNYFDNFNTTVFLFTDAYPHLFDLDDSNDDIVNNNDDDEISNLPSWYYEYTQLEKKFNKFFFINCNNETHPIKYFHQFINEIINYNSPTILHRKKKICINYKKIFKNIKIF